MLLLLPMLFTLVIFELHFHFSLLSYVFGHYLFFNFVFVFCILVYKQFRINYVAQVCGVCAD